MIKLLKHARKHRDLWEMKPDAYWLARLQEEVAELTLTLDDQHEGPMTHELRQIATICINWMYWNNALDYPDEEENDE